MSVRHISSGSGDTVQKSDSARHHVERPKSGQLDTDVVVNQSRAGSTDEKKVTEQGPSRTYT